MCAGFSDVGKQYPELCSLPLKKYGDLAALSKKGSRLPTAK